MAGPRAVVVVGGGLGIGRWAARTMAAHGSTVTR